MKYFIHTFLIIVLFTHFTFAQTVNGERVKQSILDLSRKIEQIRALAERYNNQQALNILSDARNELDEAIAYLKEWENDHRRTGRLILAKAKFQSADKKTDFAARLVLYKPVANLKTDLERLIQKAETVVHKNNNSDLVYFLNKARGFYRQAIDAFGRNRYLLGYEYVRISTYFANKIIGFGQDNKQDISNPDIYNEQKNNIENLLNQAAAMIGNDPVLTGLYNNASQYVQKSNNAFNQGNLRRAYTELQVAERMLYRLIDLADNSQGSEQNRLESNYQSLGRYLNSVRNEFEKNNRESRLLQKAESFYNKAGENLQKGEFVNAKTNINLSQSMALRAFKSLSDTQNKKDTENLQPRLNEVGRLIEMQNKRIAENRNKGIQVLHNQAVDFYQSAENAYEKGEDDKTSYLLNISLKILNKVEKIINSNRVDEINPGQLQTEISRIESFIDRLKSNTEIKEKERLKITILDEMLLKAKNEFNNKNYLSSNELINLVQKQLSSILTK